MQIVVGGRLKTLMARSNVTNNLIRHQILASTTADASSIVVLLRILIAGIKTSQVLKDFLAAYITLLLVDFGQY